MDPRDRLRRQVMFYEIPAHEGAVHFEPCPRSERLPAFVGLQSDANAKLAELDVTIVGCGAVGRPMAVHLARQQVGCLRFVDPSRYKPASMTTQAIEPDDVSQLKVLSTWLDPVSRLACV